MAVKDLAFESDARNGLLAGVEKLAAAVKSHGVKTPKLH